MAGKPGRDPDPGTTGTDPGIFDTRCPPAGRGDVAWSGGPLLWRSGGAAWTWGSDPPGTGTAQPGGAVGKVLGTAETKQSPRPKSSPDDGSSTVPFWLRPAGVGSQPKRNEEQARYLVGLDALDRSFKKADARTKKTRTGSIEEVFTSVIEEVASDFSLEQMEQVLNKVMKNFQKPMESAERIGQMCKPIDTYSDQVKFLE